MIRQRRAHRERIELKEAERVLREALEQYAAEEAAKLAENDRQQKEAGAEVREDSEMADYDPLAHIPDEPKSIAAIEWDAYETYDPLAKIPDDKKATTDVEMQDVSESSSSNSVVSGSSESTIAPKFTNPFDDNAPIELIVFRSALTHAEITDWYSQTNLWGKKPHTKEMLRRAACADANKFRRGAISRRSGKPMVPWRHETPPTSEAGTEVLDDDDDDDDDDSDYEPPRLLRQSLPSDTSSEGAPTEQSFLLTRKQIKTSRRI